MVSLENYVEKLSYTKEVFGNFGLAGPRSRDLLVKTLLPVLIVVFRDVLSKLSDTLFVCVLSEFYLNFAAVLGAFFN